MYRDRTALFEQYPSFPAIALRRDLESTCLLTAFDWAEVWFLETAPFLQIAATDRRSYTQLTALALSSQGVGK